MTPGADSLEGAAADAVIARWSVVVPRFKAWLDGGMAPATALLQLGTQLVQQSCFPEAIQCFRAAALLTPQDPNAWTNLGVALDRAQAAPEAVAALEHSLQLAPQQPDTWLLLGLSRGKTSDTEGAEAAFRMALQQEPESALGWQCLGLLKEAQKKFPQAIDCFRACLQRGRATSSLWANLAKILHQTGRISESADAYREAVALEPGNAHFQEMARKLRFMQAVLESPTIDAALVSYRESAPAGEAPDQDLEAVFHAAFGFLSGFGHREAAIRLGKKHLELWPDSSSMAYLLSAVEGKPGLDRAPANYIAEHFDAFAEGFDAQLVGALGYDIPEQIGAAVRAVSAADRRYDVVDIGCGTGLCGPGLRPLARTLVGVDLAPKMLAQAAKRGIYDELACEDVVPFLARSAGRFDLLAAADLLIYFGDLAPLFAAAAVAVRPEGLMVVSTESKPDGSYQVLASGRFAHASDYVRAVADKAWVQIATEETTIRLEATARVAGQLFVFRRR